ncbi:DUF924 family protein [Microvirga massiliensis]|uniref:DUF924 family protein n=1 Tax=Microvirga massiliensis TaxID=1033741 RepID=UPI00062BC691|nr:DUF924 family protein [Microvirga massiliensis]
MTDVATAQDVVAFWRAAGPDRWFEKDEAFDEACRERFLPTYEAAARGDLPEWETTPEGSLATVLLLDQFPRNMFRGTRRVYATDPTAVLAAERAIEKGHDREVDPSLRRFFYLPFMHAEDLAHQERSVTLNRELGDPDTLRWAEHHRDIIARFGRFPHRNALQGRESTPEEAAFLADGGFKG